MRNVKLIALLAAIAVFLSGCGVGLIYTHTQQPLTLDMHKTMVTPDSKEGNIKHIQLGHIGAAWDSAAIGDIAKKNGLRELYAADLETLSILGIWHQYTVLVYGH